MCHSLLISILRVRSEVMMLTERSGARTPSAEAPEASLRCSGVIDSLGTRNC